MLVVNIEESVEIIKASFSHLIYEEKKVFGDAHALLYFPSIGIGVFEADSEMKEQKIEKSLKTFSRVLNKNFVPVFINVAEEGFNVGQVIQDILLEGRFAPEVES